MKIRFQNIGYTLVVLGAWLTSACSEQTGVIPDEPDDSPGTIALSVEGNSLVASRSSVVDPDDNLRGKQHVTRVQLYIYKIADGDTIMVHTEDVNWQHWNGAMSGLETKKMYYTTEYQDYDSETEYLFLAVGFDDTYKDDGTFENKNSVEAYGFPDRLAKKDDKLSEGIFSLKGDDVGLISHSELFAGARIFAGKQIKSHQARNTPIDLYRRVAGIVGYFKNLPKIYDGVEVGKICLQTCIPQNTKVYFLPRYPAKYYSPKSVPDNEYIDYITSQYSGVVSDGHVVATYIPDDGDDGEFALSAYMLPMTRSEVKGISTLELVIYDKGGRPLGRSRILCRPSEQTTSRSGTGIIDIPGENNDSPNMHYPIRANHFYRIGSKNNPIDLSGQTSYIYIEIDPVWDEYYGGSIDHDEVPGLGIDNSWGAHEGGSLD